MALFVQALGYGGDEWERRFLEQPQEEAGADRTGYAAMYPELPQEEAGADRTGYAAMYPEQPQEEAEEDKTGYAGMDLYNIMAEDTGDSGTSDETGPPSDDFMREILDQPKPEDGQMVYDQDLKKEILNQPLPRKDLSILPFRPGQLNVIRLAMCSYTYSLCVPDTYIFVILQELSSMEVTLLSSCSIARGIS